MNKTIVMLALATATAQAPQAWSAPQDVPPIEKAEAQAEKRDNAVIRLAHIAPSMMAWMIAPRDFPVPGETPEPEVSYTREEMETVLRKGTPQAEIDAILNKGKRNLTPTPGRAGDLFALPKGVESITPIDVQSALLVRGTAEGIERLRAIVNFLDVPIRKVEVEVLSVRIDKADLKEFGVEWAVQSGAASLGFLCRPGYKEAVKKLLDAKRASTLLEARALMINNISGSLGSVASSEPLSLVSMVEMQLTPTINNDDTITIVMQATTKVPLGAVPQPGANMTSVANVRDGDTIAIAAPNADKNSQQATISFITARIVRRVDEKK